MDIFDLMSGMIVVFLFLIFVGIICYIIDALCLYKIAKGENACNAWFAFIPILNWYLIFQLIKGDKFDIFGKWQVEKTLATIICIVYPFVVQLIASKSLFLYSLLIIVQSIMYIAVYLNMYNSLEFKDSTLYAILTAFITPVGYIMAYKKYQEMHIFCTETVSVKNDDVIKEENVDNEEK